MRLFRNFQRKIKEVLQNPLLLLNVLLGPVDRLVCYYHIYRNTQKLRREKVLTGPVRLDQLPLALQTEFKKDFNLYSSLNIQKRRAIDGVGKCEPMQVPNICHAYMSYENGDFRRI